ncbi:roadblock/LC7 domain-containing protein [Streptomyces sp. NPDC059037]|uniref:roadblock/LC7 domain-containing protein n=1 Tax=Streptomyces sp. NPDC059037 TaxID=3346710 RepID=UPI0036BABDAA
MTTPTAPDIDWLLQTFATNTSGVRATLVTSHDGLLISQVNLAENASEVADVLSALASGVYSLAKAAANTLQTESGVDQTLFQMGNTNLVIMEAGEGALLTVVSEPGADMGQLGYEMLLLTRQMPQNLTVPPRLT